VFALARVTSLSAPKNLFLIFFPAKLGLSLIVQLNHNHSRVHTGPGESDFYGIIMCGPSKTCPYRSLVLLTTATHSEIKTAYRKAIVQVHPDKLVGASAAKKTSGEAKSKLLNAAWECLGDSDSRNLFDYQCARSTTEACSRPQQPTSDPVPDVQKYKHKYHRYESDSDTSTSGSSSASSSGKSSSRPGFTEWGDAYSGPHPPKRPRAAPEEKAAPKPRKSEVKRGDNKYDYDTNDWAFNIKISPKYHVYNNVEDITTANMDRICVSLSFTLEVNADYTNLLDGSIDSDILS
jgi:curved DNA-binding protein CbpA